MYSVNDYWDLKNRIQKHEVEHPDLIVLAVEVKIAFTSADVRREGLSAPLEEVIYKKKSCEIWLVLAPGNSWRSRNIPWNPRVVDIKVDPHRPRMDGQPTKVIFQEVEH